MTPAAPMYRQKLDDYLAFLDIFGSSKEIIQIFCEEQQVDLIIEILHSGSNRKFRDQENLWADLPIMYLELILLFRGMLTKHFQDGRSHVSIGIKHPW